MGRKYDLDGGQLQNLIPEMLLEAEEGRMSEPYMADMSKAGIQIQLCEGIRR